VLGHVIAGVEGTYDRHSYADEKRAALEKLAEMVERILNPIPSNVETLDDRVQGREHERRRKQEDQALGRHHRVR